MSLLDDLSEQPAVINIDQLSSDIEADFDDANAKDDVEIDLLNDKDTPYTNKTNHDYGYSHIDNLPIFRKRYRDIVHLIRKLNQKFETERTIHEKEIKELTNKISKSKGKLDNHSGANNDGGSLINVASEGEIAGKNNSHRQSSKLRDLERLMAKCKESLKAKNQQLKILKNSLLEVEKFKDYIDVIKNELRELQRDHEIWTLSIAENKRAAHQEIEHKNLELDNLKAEIKEMQLQLKDSNNKSSQLKIDLQNLESRTVSLSAAHQKERESLTKELTLAKNNAIKQIQRDHELQLERVKLDLERSIEKLKLELLVKDEQIIRNAEREQELQKQTCSLKSDLESSKNKINELTNELDQVRSIEKQQCEEIQMLKNQTVEIQANASSKIDNDELKSKNMELIQNCEDLTRKYNSELDKTSVLSKTLAQREDSISELTKNLTMCQDQRSQLALDSERHEQSSFELKTKLDLMTTANSDQEKVLKNLKDEKEKLNETYRLLKSDLNELTERNKTMSQVLQENENELQRMQEQLDQQSNLKRHLDKIKGDNASLSTKLEQANSDLHDKTDEVKKLESNISDLRGQVCKLEQEVVNLSNISETIRNERDSLSNALNQESEQRATLKQQLAVRILAAMKNLETPDTSPGSDKTFNSDAQETEHTESDGQLPDPIKLADKLSIITLDRNSAYWTSNQQLKAVLLDNNMIAEEVKQLKQELNALQREKTQEVRTSLEEVERLRTENQALIHDQKAYDDRIGSLEAEIEILIKRINDFDASKIEQLKVNEMKILLESKEQEVLQLKQCITELEVSKNQPDETTETEDTPDPTEFKYLKNIVYQFMMGKEPTTLARVISAVFKFTREEVEQICKVQEAIHQISS